MWLNWLVFCDYGFSLSALWCPLTTLTIFFGFLLPWSWGISSELLQQSAAAAPYLGRGVSPQGRLSWPWMWSGSSWPSCTHAATTPWTWGCSSWPQPLASGVGYKKYKHLNVEFQRISIRDKKAFISDQCKEIEEKNRMGKTRDLFLAWRIPGTREPGGLPSMGLHRVGHNWSDLAAVAEISSRKLEIPREKFMKDELNKGQKLYGPNRSRRY